MAIRETGTLARHPITGPGTHRPSRMNRLPDPRAVVGAVPNSPARQTRTAAFPWPRAWQILLACIVAAGLLTASACRHPSEPAREPASPDVGATPLREAMWQGPVATTPLFWRVSERGGATLYLLGSIHFGPPSGWKMPSEIDSTFAGSQALVLEVDDRGLSPAEMQALTLRHALLPPPETLADHVSPETFEKLRDHMARRGADVSTVTMLRPWMVSTFVALDAMAGLGFIPDTGVDRSYLSRVSTQDVIALETAESQIALLAGFAPELQELALIDSLDQAANADTTLVALAEAWQRGDEAGLVEVLNASFERDPAFEPLRELLVVERNRSMTLRLAELAEDPARTGQEVFVIVGAAHLVGVDSIVGLLEDDGFVVELIDTESARHRN